MSISVPVRIRTFLSNKADAALKQEFDSGKITQAQYDDLRNKIGSDLELIVPPSKEPTRIVISMAAFRGDALIQIQPDGLVPPNLFRWGDKSAKLTSAEYNLMELLQTAPNHRVSIEEVGGRVWGDEGVETALVRTLATKLGTKLRSVGFDFNVSVKSEYVIIDQRSHKRQHVQLY